MEKKEPCGACHILHSPEELVPFDDVMLCRHCMDEETVICARCGERIWADADAGNEEIHLCQSCFDRYYTACANCNRIILEEDAYYDGDDEYEAYCYDCHCRSRSGTIHDYCFKPEPIFYGEDTRYFGVELEIDEGGESGKHASRILAIANGEGEERMYCKHDGSLDDGFEMVTHPMTLEYHEKEMPWLEILDKARSMGYRSHQANTCGLHVHVNRSAFGETESERDECVARVLYFFEKHWEELLKFSRRTRSQLERWAERYGYKEQPKDILECAKKGRRGERYTCVNLTNPNTIEFRMFRGSLKWNTVLATLQLVDRICDVALSFTDVEIKAMSWTTFVSCCTQPELIRYLKERRLYVNDPVDAEVEV